MKKWKLKVIKEWYLRGGKQYWRLYQPNGTMYGECDTIDDGMYRVEIVEKRHADWTSIRL